MLVAHGLRQTGKRIRLGAEAIVSLEGVCVKVDAMFSGGAAGCGGNRVGASDITALNGIEALRTTAGHLRTQVAHAER